MKRQSDEITLPMEQGDVKRARVLQSLTPDQAQELAAIHAEADDMNRAQRDIIAMEETDDHNKDRLSVQTDLMKAMVTLRALEEYLPSQPNVLTTSSCLKLSQVGDYPYGFNRLVLTSITGGSDLTIDRTKGDLILHRDHYVLARLSLQTLLDEADHATLDEDSFELKRTTFKMLYSRYRVVHLAHTDTLAFFKTIESDCNLYHCVKTARRSVTLYVHADDRTRYAIPNSHLPYGYHNRESECDITPTATARAKAKLAKYVKDLQALSTWIANDWPKLVEECKADVARYDPDDTLVAQALAKANAEEKKAKRKKAAAARKQ